MGFFDAFNQQRDWWTNSYLAIDQGPIILMIENHRSRLLWDLFMSNPEIQPMMEAIGFFDAPNTAGEITIEQSFTIFPNPASSDFQLIFSADRTVEVQLDLYSMTGQLKQRVLDRVTFQPGRHSVNITGGGMVPGIYTARLILDGNESETIKIIIQ